MRLHQGWEQTQEQRINHFNNTFNDQLATATGFREPDRRRIPLDASQRGASVHQAFLKAIQEGHFPEPVAVVEKLISIYQEINETTAMHLETLPGSLKPEHWAINDSMMTYATKLWQNNAEGWYLTLEDAMGALVCNFTSEQAARLAHRIITNTAYLAPDSLLKVLIAKSLANQALPVLEYFAERFRKSGETDLGRHLDHYIVEARKTLQKR